MVPSQTLHAKTKPYARDSSWKSWGYILSATFLLAAAIAGTFPPLPLPLRIACSILTGLLMVRLFVIYHDQQHHSILPKSRLARDFHADFWHLFYLSQRGFGADRMITITLTIANCAAPTSVLSPS